VVGIVLVWLLSLKTNKGIKVWKGGSTDITYLLSWWSMSGVFDRIIQDSNNDTGNKTKIFRHPYGNRLGIAIMGLILYFIVIGVQSVADALLVNQIHKVVKWGPSKLATIKPDNVVLVPELYRDNVTGSYIFYVAVTRNPSVKIDGFPRTAPIIALDNGLQLALEMNITYDASGYVSHPFNYSLLYNTVDAAPEGIKTAPSCIDLEKYIQWYFVTTNESVNWYASAYSFDYLSREGHSKQVDGLPSDVREKYIQTIVDCINDTVYIGHEKPQLWEMILLGASAFVGLVAFAIYTLIYRLRLRQSMIVRYMSRLSAKYERDILLNSALDLGICALAVDYADFDYEWDIIDQNGNRHLGPKATTNRSALIELVNGDDYIRNNLFGQAPYHKAGKAV
jgi:hypothetical protein